MKKIYPKGQVLLIVLLVMAVGLVVVLSVVSRSITDISISTKEEEALRAFSAAEAGVEKALLGFGSGTTTFSGGFEERAQFLASVIDIGIGDDGKSFIYPQEILAGDTATLWLVSHDANNNLVCSADQPCFTGSQLQVCWGKQGTPSDSSVTPAIELSVVYLATPANYATARIGRALIDPNPDETRRGGNPTNVLAQDPGNCTIAGTTFEFGKVIDLSAAAPQGLNIPSASYSRGNGLQVAKTRMFYNTSEAQPVAFKVVTGSQLPSQGRKIESSGTSGEAERKIEVSQVFPDLPPIFDNAIFTPSGITQ